MTKHTEGPWIYGDDMRGTARVFAGNQEIVRALSKHGVRRLSAKEREANARLIAAAPALLEALEILHDETKDYVEINNLGDPYHNRSMELARAAIAAAKGEGE